jgi:YidC/Oxa1 family membrane protein insertase
MEERRLLLAVALSLLVLTAYQLLFAPPPRSSSRRPPPPAAAIPAAASPPATPAPAQPREVADERERRVEVHAAAMTLALTNRGGRVVSWRLSDFKDDRGRPEEMVQTVPGGPRPLDVETGDASVDDRLREALFRASVENLEVAPQGETELKLHWAEGELQAEKVLRFRPGVTLVSVSVSVRRAGQELSKRLLWGPGVGNPTAGEMEVQGYLPPQAVALGPAGVERIPVEKLGSARALPAVRWAGVESTYFAALWIPPGDSGPAVLRAVSLPGGEEGKPRLGAQAGLELGTSVGPALLYVGPKDHQALSRLGHGLAAVVDIGDWIGPIVVPLMALLRFVQGHVGNYGWSIVLLTVLINLILAPLRHYSIANGIKMAKLAPEMKVIQERYRKVPALDARRQEMQKEIAALYARHGMSMGTQMAVGCLPLLLTMPFLIAFYRVLVVSIELRGAPFLWITDLSRKDPLFVTPLLMGGSMFVMQKMTPTAMDPAQQRMMLIMPLVLMLMFLWAPAGLNLYWLASNLCSILQQAITLRIVRGGEGAAASRRRRR